MTKYFTLGIGLKRFVSSPLVTGAKPGLNLYAPNNAGMADQTYFGDFIQPVTGVLSETLAVPVQALAGTVTAPSTGITFVIDEALAAPTQALAGDVTKPVFTSVIAETLAAPTQALAGGVTKPVFTSVISEILAAPVQALTGDVTPPAGTVTFAVAETLAPPTQALAGDVTDPIGTTVTFTVAQEVAAPSENIEVVALYHNRNTGFGGLPRLNNADAPKFQDPGRSVKYDPARVVKATRMVTQSAPAPVQGIRVLFLNSSESSGKSAVPPPFQRGMVKSSHRSENLDDEALLMLFMEVT
jgi:hypothetical protein